MSVTQYETITPTTRHITQTRDTATVATVRPASACKCFRQSANKKRKPNQLRIRIDTSTRPSVHLQGEMTLPPLEDTFATKILPHLWLGDFRDATNVNALRKTGITHILNVAQECQSGECTPPAEEMEGINVLNIPLRDANDEDISPHFADAIQFIETVKEEKGRVLVHCRVGISRSATIVLAYLMRMNNWGFADALSHVRLRRNVVNPNLGFVLALEDFEKQLVGAQAKLKKMGQLPQLSLGVGGGGGMAVGVGLADSAVPFTSCPVQAQQVDAVAWDAAPQTAVAV
eukprot:TRINITY_DN66844_c7_g4_i1.p1 TRINITY_DN66844_c7_g4~~TRINITY_DN66844_c7_g4_i1.p1  ORF type:complete len:314 (+),score=8.25 TRINITY_DN66844_c7_g4_i1:80-943(+)